MQMQLGPGMTRPMEWREWESREWRVEKRFFLSWLSGVTLLLLLVLRLCCATPVSTTLLLAAGDLAAILLPATARAVGLWRRGLEKVLLVLLLLLLLLLLSLPCLVSSCLVRSFSGFAYAGNFPVLQDLCAAFSGFGTSLSSISTSLERPCKVHHGERVQRTLKQMQQLSSA